MGTRTHVNALTRAKRSYRCAMDHIDDATLLDSDLLNTIGDLGSRDFEHLLSDNPVGQRKMCKSCKTSQCAKECFDNDRKTCRGCLRVKKTYQRRKRKEKLLRNANETDVKDAKHTTFVEPRHELTKELA